MENKRNFNIHNKNKRGTESNFNGAFSKAQRISVNRRGRAEAGGQKRKRALPIVLTIVIDVFIGALILLVFYLNDYVLVPDVSGVSLAPAPSVVSAIEAPAATAIRTTSPEPAGSAAVDPSTVHVELAGPVSWRTKFADKFTDVAVEKTATSYKSANINVSVNKVQENGVTYFFADIYVADIKYLKTAFGVNPDKLGGREFVDQSSKENNGIIAINGSMCTDNPGLIIRNGKFYPKWTKSSADQLVMYNDGTMQTFSPKEFNFDKIKGQAPYQVWAFGPMLLKDGQPMTKFNSSVTGPNPRTAIGFFEPGHYCFVDVDGRQPGYSKGYTMAQLSKKMYDLGCKVAFNLDGGGSTQMAFMGARISSPCSDFRKVSDDIYITDI